MKRSANLSQEGLAMTHGTHEATGEKPPVNWAARIFIGMGVGTMVLLFWFANGQPGMTLRDGDYGCARPNVIGGAGGAPGATVRNGELVDVWSFSMATGTKSSLPWNDFERKDATTFVITSQDTLSGSVQRFECTRS